VIVRDLRNGYAPSRRHRARRIVRIRIVRAAVEEGNLGELLIDARATTRGVVYWTTNAW